MSRRTRGVGTGLRAALERLPGRRRPDRSAPMAPWAQPRPRFDLPEQSGPAAGTQDGPEAEEAPRVVADLPPSALRQRAGITQRPIYTGFMVTVGVGLALLFYYVAVNVGALGGWITGAMFIALGLDPLVRWIEARGLPRPVGVGAVLLILAGLATLLGTVVIPTIARQALDFLNNFPDTFDRFLESDFMVTLDQQWGIRDRVDAEAGNFFSSLFSDSNVVGSFLNSLINAGSTIAQVITGTLIVMFLALYFLASLPTIKAWGVRLAPTSRRPRVEELTERITRSVGNYVMGQAIVALLNATVAFILMTIVGVPFPLLTAFVVALLAFVPLVGGVVAGILVTFIALLQGWQTALIYALCYFAYLQVEAYYVSPRIMKRAVAVPAAVAVIAVAGGGALWGVLGAIVAIPVAASALLLVREVLVPLQDRR
jgi:predicted PurR-regulated permease PerM